MGGEEGPITLVTHTRQAPQAKVLTTTPNEFSVILGNFISDRNSPSLQIYIISPRCQATASAELCSDGSG